MSERVGLWSSKITTTNESSKGRNRTSRCAPRACSRLSLARAPIPLSRGSGGRVIPALLRSVPALRNGGTQVAMFVCLPLEAG